MTQQWLSITGITLDGLAFLLLLFEWWWGLRSEAWQLMNEKGIADHHSHREIAQIYLPARMRPHLAQIEDWADHVEHRRKLDMGLYSIKERKALFYLAALLALTGTALQLAGAWPGCCAELGILPQL